MNEFNLSDKELKALLQNEGLDEPSLSFNRNILEQIKADEKRSSFLIPNWVKIVFILLVISPLAYLGFIGGSMDLGIQALNGIKVPEVSLNFGLDSTYQYILFLAVGVAWMAFIFNRFLDQQNQSKVKKG
ncbi:MAG: hypothetical protein ACJAVN_000286 [Roseivirga sp.]|jgi:hypothetical protein